MRTFVMLVTNLTIYSAKVQMYNFALEGLTQMSQIKTAICQRKELDELCDLTIWFKAISNTI